MRFSPIKLTIVCTQARLNSGSTSSEIDRQVNDLLQSALSIYQIKIDILQQLQPTHIISQDQCELPTPTGR